MSSSWPIKSLGDVLVRTETVDPGQSPESEFEYVDVSAVSNETFQITETQRLQGKDAPSRARRLIRRNDVLFATVRPTLQRVAVVPAELDRQVCSTGYFVMRPKPELNHRWLFYSLFTESFMGQMAALQKGASYPAVNDSDVRAQGIPIPPLAEQQRIVSMLDEAFAAIAAAKDNTEKNLSNARAVFASASDAILAGCAEATPRRLEEVAASDCTLSYGIVQPGEEQESGLIIVRPVDLGPKYIRAAGLKRIDPSLAKAYVRTRLQGNELLLCVRGTTGTVGVATDELKDGNVTRGLVPVRFNQALVRRDFGYYLLKSDSVQNQIRAKTYGAALMQINIKDVRDLSVRIPGLVEQDRAVRKLDVLERDTERLESLAQQKLAALDALKKSLLHHAFTGQLTDSSNERAVATA